MCGVRHACVDWLNLNTGQGNKVSARVDRDNKEAETREDRERLEGIGGGIHVPRM